MNRILILLIGGLFANVFDGYTLYTYSDAPTSSEYTTYLVDNNTLIHISNQPNII